MKKLLLFVYIFSSLSLLMAGDDKKIYDPQWDYVNSPVFPNDLEPVGDSVLRLDLDIYGNGKPVVFLSFQNFSNRSGNTWTVYMPLRGGDYKRTDYTSEGDLIVFRTDGFFSIDKTARKFGRGGLNVLYPSKGGGQFVYYSFQNGNITSKDGRAITFTNKEDSQYVERLLGGSITTRRESGDGKSTATISASAVKAAVH